MLAILFFIVAAVLIVLYLRNQTKQRQHWRERLSRSGFSFDEVIALGDSELIIDRTKQRLAFIHFSLTHRSGPSVGGSRRWKSMGEAIRFSEVTAVRVEKPNNRTHRAVWFDFTNEGSTYGALAVVPARSLEKVVLHPLTMFVETDLSKTIEFTEPLY